MGASQPIEIVTRVVTADRLGHFGQPGLDKLESGRPGKGDFRTFWSVAVRGLGLDAGWMCGDRFGRDDDVTETRRFTLYSPTCGPRADRRPGDTVPHH